MAFVFHDSTTTMLIYDAVCDDNAPSIVFHFGVAIRWVHPEKPSKN